MPCVVWAHRTIPAVFSTSLGDTIDPGTTKGGKETWLDDIMLHSKKTSGTQRAHSRSAKASGLSRILDTFDKVRALFPRSGAFEGHSWARWDAISAMKGEGVGGNREIFSNVGEVGAILGIAGFLREFFPVNFQRRRSTDFRPATQRSLQLADSTQDARGVGIRRAGGSVYGGD